MKSGMGWRVKGVRPEARETAREAARRSGMSVGEWLDTVIVDSALDEGVPPSREAEPHYPDYELRAQPQPKRRSSPELDERHRPAPDTGLAEVNDRLDSLCRQLDKLAGLNAAPAPRNPARDEEGTRQFAAAIGKLQQRLDELTAARSRPKEPVDVQAGTADRMAADAHHDRPRLPAAAPATPLDQAMMEIADRQRALEGYPAMPAAAMPAAAMPAPAPTGPLPRARTQEFHGLEQQLRDINSQIENLNRPCPVDTAMHKAVDTLRDDLAEIGVMLQEAMPRKAVEALEGEMRKLAERIDHTRQSGAESSALGGLERGLAEVRDALRGLTPAESLAGLDDAVKGLAQKIDSLALGQQDPAALKQLEGAIVAMRGIASHVASNDALATLADEVRTLAAKVEHATSDSDVLSTIERRIGTLADALEARNQGSQNVPSELEAVVRSLGDKIEQLHLSRGDQAAVGQLEDRIVQLVEKLDASDARLNQLEAIERGLAELLIHIEHNRVPQLVRADEAKPAPARVDALQRDLANLQQVERKTQDSLETVQGTLGDVVDRLAMIETEIQGRVEQAVMETAKAVIASAIPSPPAKKAEAEAKPVPPDVAVAVPFATLPAAPTLPAPAPEPVEYAADAPQAKPAPPVAAERRPIDPNLPPDHPLEPGSGASRGGRHGPSPADRIAASEAALVPAKPPVIADPGGKSNFIAAARRAAQAATSAEVSARGSPNPAAAGPTVSQMGRLVGMARKHARTVIVGISVIVIVLGSLNIVRTWFGGTDEPEGPVPWKTSPQCRPPRPKRPVVRPMRCPEGSRPSFPPRRSGRLSPAALRARRRGKRPRAGPSRRSPVRLRHRCNQ
jgi:localization factor PodJL